MDTNAEQLVEALLQSQESERHSKKCKQQIKELYQRMDHKIFMEWLIRVIGMAMQVDENVEVANRLLRFCAHTVAIFEVGRAENENRSHPVVVSTFDWLVGTTSEQSHLRFRLCQFVNLLLDELALSLGPEALMDDEFWSRIDGYALEHLLDTVSKIRIQATQIMGHLVHLRSYTFHIESVRRSKNTFSLCDSVGL